MLGDALQDVAEGRVRRLMVFMPPREGKSEEVSRLFSGYYLYRHPSRWVGLNSYAADLAYTLSRAAQENYRAGGGRIKGSASAVKHWETPDGGGFWAAGVGGPITGKGFHLGIIDDPLKNAEEANSEVIREKQKEWYRSTFYTREEPGGSIIVVQTRWHEDDLSGWLLSEESGEDPERWTVLSLPAISEATRPAFPSTCRVIPDWRAPGVPLNPERRDLGKLHQIGARIGDYFFDSLYQQRPSAKSGSFFKVGEIGLVDALPVGLQLCRAWDQAATEGSGDYTAGVLMGKGADGLFYVSDVARGRWDTDARNKEILLTAGLDGRGVRIQGAQDPGSGGKDAAKHFVKMLAGYTVKAEPVSGGKESRADPFSAQVNAGNVRMVRGDWNRAFIEELRQFPRGAHDDQVDAAADAFNELTLGVSYSGGVVFPSDL